MVENEHGMFVNTVLSSMAANSGIHIETLHIRMPRMLLAELNTHRVFSRNSRSSRAVPGKSMFAEIDNDPFVPWHWTANQAGMQGEKGHDAPIYGSMCHLDMIENRFDPVTNRDAWLWARDRALEVAKAFERAGYHKQIFNRLVEPFMWVDTLVTSTEWANFLHLRDHPAAEPHFRDLAQMVKEERDASSPQILEPGEWHFPYITQADLDYAQKGLFDDEEGFSFFSRISAARCARISYTPFDGDPSYERELDRYDLLVGGGAVHASPLEHQATPDELVDDGLGLGSTKWAHPKLHGNLRGWVQFRKTVPGEAVFDE